MPITQENNFCEWTPQKQFPLTELCNCSLCELRLSNLALSYQSGIIIVLLVLFLC